MTTPGYKYPLPQPEKDDKPFWDAARRHELVAQRCARCKQFQHPPGQTCPNCHGEKFEWVKLSGRGVVYTFVIVHQPVNPAFRDKVPYHVVQVTPEDAPGIHITGNVVGTENSKLVVGMPVEAIFDDVTPQITLVRWQAR